jgi:hypothetical protein
MSPHAGGCDVARRGFPVVIGLCQEGGNAQNLRRPWQGRPERWPAIHGGGAILFRPPANHELQAYGEIAEDGTFTLHTLGHTKSGHAQKLEGTIEGEFQVQIEPPMGKGRPFWLTKTYRIEPNEKNEITVVVEK